MIEKINAYAIICVMSTLHDSGNVNVTIVNVSITMKLAVIKDKFLYSKLEKSIYVKRCSTNNLEMS